jgi:tetratricopeptide (TPR) repeat protein
MSNALKLKKRAAELEQKKQYDKALALYLQILEEGDPLDEENDVALYNRVGDLMFRLGNVGEALTYYEKAIDLYSERGFLNNAIALCNKILRQSPGRSSIYYKLGKISAKKGFKSDAKKNFLEYADRMQQSGHIDEAFRALTEFADLCPDQDDIRLMLAEQLSKENRREEALAQLQTLYQKLESEGRRAEARATADRMKAIDPEAVPQASGSYQAQKAGDLVFLDVSYEEPTRSRSAPPAQISDPDLVTVTLGNDIAPTSLEETLDVEPPRIAGFTPTASAAIGESEDAATDTPPSIRPLDLTPAFVESIDPDRTANVSDSVDGLETSDVFATDGAPPSLSILEDAPLSGSEFAELELQPVEERRPIPMHDLALPGELPTLGEPPAEMTIDLDLPQPELPPIAVAPDPDVVELLEIGPALTPLAGGAEALGDRTDTIDLGESLEQALRQPVEIDVDADDALPMLDIDAPGALGSPSPLAMFDGTIPKPDPTVEEADAAMDALDLQPVEVEDLSRAATPAAGLPASDDATPVEPPPVVEVVGEVTFIADVVPPREFVEEPLARLAAEVETPADLAAVPNDDAPFDEPSLVDAPFDEPSLDDAPPPPRWPTPPPLPVAPLSVPPRSVLDEMRERLEAEPENSGLRRRFAERLLDEGEREEGVQELEVAMLGFDERGDLENAYAIAEELIRLDPRAVRHHQKRVEYAVRASDRGRLIEAYLALADSLFADGETTKSEVVYQRVVELDPGNLRAAAALQVMGAPPSPFLTPPKPMPPVPARAATPMSAPPVRPMSTPPVRPMSPPVVPAVPAVAARAEAPARGGSDAAAGAERRGGDDDFVDLGEWLRADEQPKSTRMITETHAPSGDEDADFAEMLRRFKRGVAENVEEEDYDSHYDLGVAYKEMGLVDEAIAEFQKALRGTAQQVRAYEALGQCFIEKSQFPIAAALLSRALVLDGIDDNRLVGVLYLLGFASEALGKAGDALTYYRRVFAVDIEFRDIGDRLMAMERMAQ